MSITPTANISSKCSPSPSRHFAYGPAPSPARPPSPSLYRSPPPPTSPTKRHRPSRPNMAAKRASSHSESSQSGVTDNETELDRSAPQTVAPPKKKRTRTLTTPHQSAVLHALLAKSRFPTTAMREEVGRQIGLSARKVQIWFQNQRQKARRPQADSAPLSRPPQFGPFPIITSAGPSSSSYPSPSTTGPSEVSHSAPSSAKSTHDSAASLDSTPTLSGPGIPNWLSSSYLSPEERDPSRRPPTSPAARSGNSQHPQLSQGISARDSRGNTRGLAPPPAQSTHGEPSPHFSALLPPITLSPLGARSGAESYVSATSSVPPQPPSRTFVNIFHASALPAAEQGSPARPNIPPPFVLQPQPQWDPQMFVPYTRPAFSSWLQPMASARTTLSSVGGCDRVTHTPSSGVSRHRHFYSSPGEPHLHSHHIIQPPPSRTRQFSISAPSSHASVSRERHARSDNEAEED